MLSEVEQKFILHWGEMGTKWGINRTVAQMHALLYLSEHPLPADEIAEKLSVARSNVSTSLRELQSWRLVKPVHVRGDRREHYETLTDVWEMFRVIVTERKRREVDPSLGFLKECLDDAQADQKTTEHVSKSIAQMYDFFSSVDDSYQNLERLPTSSIRKLFKLGKRLKKILPLA